MKKILIAVVIVIMASILFWSVHQALAREQYPGQYDNVDPKIHEWYHGLRNDIRGIICCDLSDCHPVEMAFKDNKYYAILETGERIEIPPEAILPQKYEIGNPTGQAVVCYRTFTNDKDELKYDVFCFVRGSWS